MVAGLGERDVRADLGVRIPALGADRERLAVAARGAAVVAELAAGIAEHEQRERAEVGRAVGPREGGLRGDPRIVELADREQRVAAVELGRAQLRRGAEVGEHAPGGREPGQGLARAAALRQHGAEVELGDRRRVDLADVAEPAGGLAVAIAGQPELAALLRDHAPQRQRAPDGRRIVARGRADLQRGERGIRVVELAEVEAASPAASARSPASGAWIRVTTARASA